MENENMKIPTPEEEVNSATVCDTGEELAICNCENQEEVTVYESEDLLDSLEDIDSDEEIELDFDFADLSEDGETAPAESIADRMTRKCREVKELCNSTAARLVNDWKETNGNPYIKQTQITQIDIYRSPDDDIPVDTFRTEQVRGYSARSLAILGAASIIVACTADCIWKKLLKK